MYFNDPLTYEQRGIQSGIVDVLGTTCSCKSIQRTRHCSPVESASLDDELSRSLIQTSPVTRRGTEQEARASNNKTKTYYRVSDETERRREICQAQDHRIYDRSIVEFSERKPKSTKGPRKGHETSIFLFFSFSCSSRSSSVSFQADTFPLASCRKIRDTRSGIDQQAEFPRDTILDLDQRLLPCLHEHCLLFSGNPLFLVDRSYRSLFTRTLLSLYHPRSRSISFASMSQAPESIRRDRIKYDHSTTTSLSRVSSGKIQLGYRSLSRQKFTHEDIDVVP